MRLFERVFVIPSILLGFAIGAMTAPVVADGLDRVDRAEQWRIERHKMLVSGVYTREEVLEIDEDFEEESYWVQHREQFERWTAHANDFLRDVRLSK